MFLGFVPVALSGGADSCPAGLQLCHARLSLSALGSARIGMTIAESATVLGITVAYRNGRDDECETAVVADDPGVSFMLEHGRVTRFDLTDAHHVTVGGGRVGDTEARIRALYPGRLEVAPHAYIEGHYLTIRSANREFALVFETDGERVTSIRAGRLPFAEYVEGCS